MRSQWRMAFLSGGEPAVVLFESDPADVVITDMRMPGMDGAALLGTVRQRWPGTVRFILSGYTDQNAALRSVGVAHRFVSKPCDPGLLLAAVRDACEVLDRFSVPGLRGLVCGVDALPSPPTSSADIAEALARSDVSAEHVVSLVERDPGSAATLLHVANSAFFGLARSVTSVQDAVACLGIGPVRAVLLAAGPAGRMRCETADMARLTEEVSADGMTVANAARERVPGVRAQEAYTAGLLHGIGWLALAAVATKQVRAVRRDIRDGVASCAAERQQLGTTHAEVGGCLLRLWDLPASLVNAVAHHRDLAAPGASDPVVAAVAVAVSELAVAHG